LKELRVSRSVLEEAQREGSSREFFFKLVQLLSGGKLSRKDIKTLEHRELIYRIVKENSLEKYFFPSKAKNIYNALRNAFRLKEREELEEAWNERVKSWREEFEEVLVRAANRYLDEVKDRELLLSLYEEGWLLTSELLSSFKGNNFEEWIVEISTPSFLEERLSEWLSLWPFKRREKILKDILKAYRLNCLELAIYALFPQCEGVIWDAFVRWNILEADIEALIRKRNRKFVTIQYFIKLLLTEIFGKEELPPFLNWLPFVDYQEGTLNRHAIQHGVAVNFASRENFLKLFYFLDFLAEVISYAKS
jgi:hypothetical protein